MHFSSKNQEATSSRAAYYAFFPLTPEMCARPRRRPARNSRAPRALRRFSSPEFCWDFLTLQLLGHDSVASRLDRADPAATNSRWRAVRDLHGALDPAARGVDGMNHVVRRLQTIVAAQICAEIF